MWTISGGPLAQDCRVTCTPRKAMRLQPQLLEIISCINADDLGKSTEALVRWPVVTSRLPLPFTRHCYRIIEPSAHRLL
ncbi:hypothetical protein RRG08_021934 [Elysia crispata]|uniref:Uncharacterized protein n=1 Tax=Elysia crispata TaxID=231223 RepID=A0AAE1AC04_9GAST|nr:hypothetical protein RRG08_021934 [Elysia crispata]